MATALIIALMLTVFLSAFTAMFWTIDGAPIWWLRRRFHEGDVIGALYAATIGLETSRGGPAVAVIVATNREALVLKAPGRTWAISWREARQAEIYHVPRERRS